MKILFYLSRYPGIGGIENVTTIIVERLLKHCSISILSHKQQEGVSLPLELNLYTMPDSIAWNSRINYDFFKKVVEENKFDAIVYQDSYAPTEHIVCKISKDYKIPLYVFEHNSPMFIYNKRNLDPITTPKGFLRRLLHPYLLHKEIIRKRYLLDHCRKYVLLSKQYIPEFCNLIGADVHDKRITYINNPATSIEAGKTIKKENIILCVARLAKEKSVDKMIRIWSDLAPITPDWKFIIVGDGPEKSKLEGIVKKNNIPRVEFTGFAKPTKYYQKSKIFWMTSKYEGWPMTLVEAMQQGCVPIGYETFSSIRDIIDSGRNGYLVEPNNENMFKNHTILLAKDDTHRSQLANLAIKKTEEFSLDMIINKWIKTFE